MVNEISEEISALTDKDIHEMQQHLENYNAFLEPTEGELLF